MDTVLYVCYPPSLPRLHTGGTRSGREHVTCARTQLSDSCAAFSIAALFLPLPDADAEDCKPGVLNDGVALLWRPKARVQLQALVLHQDLGQLERPRRASRPPLRLTHSAPAPSPGHISPPVCFAQVLCMGCPSHGSLENSWIPQLLFSGSSMGRSVLQGWPSQSESSELES